MAYAKQLYDNIFKDSAFLAYVRMSGAVQKQDGGERVAIPLMYGDNETVNTHSGEEVIDTTIQDGLTTAFYEWAEVAGSISITRKEERQNSGEGRLLNLLESKIKQAEMTMTEYLNTSLLLGKVSSATFVPNTSLGGADGLNPLGYFFRKVPSTDPVAGGNVGNISGSTYDWWRHVAATFDSSSTPTGGKFGVDVTTYAGMIVAMRRFYNFLSRGSGGAPDLFVGDQVSFETYENALDQKTRYQNTSMADMGFDTIKVRGATFIWDEKVPDVENGTEAITNGTVFGLNTKFWKLCIDSQTDIVTTPFVEPENQTVKTAKILFMGQTTCSNLRKCGVAFDIDQTIVA